MGDSEELGGHALLRALLQTALDRPDKAAAVRTPLTLRVRESAAEDEGFGRVRLAMTDREQSGLTVGSPVVVRGPRGVTAAVVWRQDIPMWPGEAQLDVMTREDVGAAVGADVTVEPVVLPGQATVDGLASAKDVPAATLVRVRPVVHVTSIPNELRDRLGQYLRHALLISGQKVRAVSLMQAGQPVVLQVEATEPSGCVRVAESTRVELLGVGRSLVTHGLSKDADGAVLWFDCGTGLLVSQEDADALVTLGVPYIKESDKEAGL